MISQALKHDYAGLVLTAVVSIIGTLGVVQADFFKFKANQLDLAYQRLAILEERMDEMQAELRKRDLEIASLSLRLAQATDPLEGIFAYIESLEAPAWIKQYNPDTAEMVMLYINDHYVRNYDISKARYVGSTDFEIWGNSVARQYYANDMQVLDNRDFQSFTEIGPNLMPDGTLKMMPTRFWKFYVKLADGRELIAGVQIKQIGGQP